MREILFSRCGDWYEVAELKQQRIAELEAEVERLEGELIVESTRRKNAVDAYHEARQKVAREIFEEIKKIFVHRLLHSRDAIDDISGDLDELKKKYVKDCRNCIYFAGCEAACGGRPCDGFKAEENKEDKQ